MLPRRHRLTRASEFSAVLRRAPGAARARRGDRLMVVTARRVGGSGSVRVGFVVSKAVGGAVVRNRVRRRLRALIAERLQQLAPGTSVVVRALPAAATASWAELGRSMEMAIEAVTADEHSKGERAGARHA